MKLFRHQPLLLWTFSLALMLAVLAIGMGGERTEKSLPARPLAASGFDHAQELLESLPGVHAAIAAGELERWSAQMSELAAEGRELDVGGDQVDHWDDVLSSIEDVTGAAGGGEPAAVLSELEDLGSSVMELNRSYQRP